MEVIGVVQAYNHQLLMETQGPVVLMYRPDQFHALQVKYVGSYAEIGADIEAAWTRVNPGLKVAYKDFSAEVHKIYDVFFGDLVDILGAIATLAIIISCMGLLGMATYTIETRIKEVSMRKVLGSSDAALVFLLSKGFMTILIVAIMIAVPCAYFLNNLWLEKLAYHITISASMLSLGVAILLLFGAVTIASQTWKASFINPVNNLKE